MEYGIIVSPYQRNIVDTHLAFKQQDHGQVLCITVDNYDTTDMTAKIVFRRCDGVNREYDITQIDGVYRYTLSADDTYSAGKVVVDLKFYKAGVRESTASFIYEVIADETAEHFGSGDYSDSLQQVLEQCQDIIEQFQQANPNDYNSLLNKPIEEKDLTVYLASSFGRHDETLHFNWSNDGKKWFHVGKVYTPPYSGEIVRDPSYIYKDGMYYVTYTTHWNNNYIRIIKSPDLISWDNVATVEFNDYAQAWGPQFFEDTDGSLYILIALSTINDPNFIENDFKMFEIHCTSDDLTEWSTPTLITGNFPYNYIDGNIIKHNGVYYFFYKNEDTDYVEYATSTSPMSGYVVEKSGDFASWGNCLEGMAVIMLPNGVCRLYLDDYINETYYYSECSDLVAGEWSQKVEMEYDFKMQNFCLLKTNKLMDILKCSASVYKADTEWIKLIDGCNYRKTNGFVQVIFEGGENLSITANTSTKIGTLPIEYRPTVAITGCITYGAFGTNSGNIYVGINGDVYISGAISGSYVNGNIMF